MKKIQLVELISSKYPEIPPQTVEFWCERAFNDMVYGLFRKDLSNVDFFCKSYRNVAIERDAYGEWFSTLPVAVLQLPDSADGVRRIYQNNNNTNLMFVPIERDAFSVYAELEVALLDNTVGYSSKFKKVTYDRNPGIPSVSMDLAIPFSEYDDFDDINLPSGSDLQFVAAVTQFITGTPPENKINN